MLLTLRGGRLPSATASQMFAGLCRAHTAPSGSRHLLGAARPSALPLKAGATPPPGDLQEVQPLIARRQLERFVPVEQFAIAGVSFEGRQELVRELKPDEIVLLVKEPWNVYDDNAMGVWSLRNGALLGYVPRKDSCNARHLHEQQFASVLSVGQGKVSGLYGAVVASRPTLMSLTLDVLPVAHGGADVSAERLLGARWPQLEQQVLEAAVGLCQVSGLDARRAPLQVVPVWRYNSAAKAVQLVQLVALCKPLVGVKRALEKELFSKDVLGNVMAQRFQGINSLGPEDMAWYVQHVRERTRRLDAEAWRVEVLL